MYARSMGMDVIRLPIRMFHMTGGAPDYILDPELLKFLDVAVDWAEKYKTFIILDNHSSYTNEEALIAVWTQMAERFKNRSRLVVYEVLNEPNKPAEEWGPIQGRVIDAIRKVDAIHAIVVDNMWMKIEPYSDSNLVYTFHFYDPYFFTHSGENWGSPPHLTNLKGLPFPASAHALPPIPSDLKGTWVESALRDSYAGDADEAKLAASLDKAADYARKWNAKVFCGEFGAMLDNNFQEDRVRYYRTICRLLDERNIARTSWDYYGVSGFGVFKTGGSRDFYSELNVDLVKAMGFMAPTQEAPKVVNAGFTIYDDYTGKHIEVAYKWWKKSFSLEDADATEGVYAVRWRNPTAYERFSWTFLSTVDWESLRSSGYAIRFKAKALLGKDASGKAFEFDVRLVNPETGGSRPWRTV
jgi:endoglucanase